MSNNSGKKPTYLISICQAIAKDMQDYITIGGDEEYDCKDYNLPEPQTATDVIYVLGYLQGYLAKCETKTVTEMLKDYIKQLELYSNAILDVQ
mgnify:FL=1